MRYPKRPVLAAACGLALLLGSAGAGAQPKHDAAGLSGPHAAQFSAQYDGPGAYDGAAGYGPGPEGYGPGGPGGYGPGYGPGGYAMGRPGGYGPGGPGYGPGGGYGGQGGPRAVTSYHGYRVALGAPARSAEGARELASVRRQVAIVERAGLRGDAIQTFRRQPIEFGQRGHYSPEAVFIGAQAGSRPVLLHEFMHVYHRDRLPGGFANPDIQAFYQQALANGRYPAGAYMLQDVREFFAMTASTFLNGRIARPPYTRAALRAAQPEYYAYLARLFHKRG